MASFTQIARNSHWYRKLAYSLTRKKPLAGNENDYFKNKQQA